VESTWFALDTDRGSACPGASVDSFVAQVDNARLVSAGGGPAATGGGSDWQRQLISLVQWLDPRIQDQLGVTVSTEDVAGLPLIETPTGQAEQPTFAVMLSGDGGWAALDRGLSAELAARGIRTVGWDSLAYFWKARSPEEASPDLARVIDHYLGAWHKGRVVLIGYSLGADVLPFLVSRLPASVRGSVALVVLLGPSPAASFEFHLSDWFSSSASSDAVATLPEIQRLAPIPRLCIYGDAEQLSVCPALAGSGVALRKVPGDHHFDNDYKGLADLILNALGTADQADP
jgi:type IV secretory pathway VirJ component